LALALELSKAFLLVLFQIHQVQKQGLDKLATNNYLLEITKIAASTSKDKARVDEKLGMKRKKVEIIINIATYSIIYTTNTMYI
jgi:hypothetical protein